MRENRRIRFYEHLEISAPVSCLLLCISVTLTGQVFSDEPDLFPVKFHTPPKHPPLSLVRQGKSAAAIYVMHPAMNFENGKKGHRSSPPDAALYQLQEFIKRATGAELPVVYKPEKLSGPGIVLGDCAAAAAQGLVGSQMPREGYAIKTTKDYVFIVGNDGPTPAARNNMIHGTAYGISEFLERYVNVRWYFLKQEIGLSIPKSESLTIPAVHLSDAPVFRKRRVRPKPSLQSVTYGYCTYFNRTNNSLPQGFSFAITNTWGRVKEFWEGRPEIFQLNADGSRHSGILCFGNPRTLETYLEQIERQLLRAKEGVKKTKADRVRDLPFYKNSIGVTPHYAYDIECQCTDCRKLWDTSAQADGTASLILGSFISKLAASVKKRWPEMKVCFGPYRNYFAAPTGITFPDNVYLHLMNKPGIALYAQEVHARKLQATIDQWFKLTGHKLQFTDYCRWPGETTRAPFQYPNALQTYYKTNREKIYGTQMDTTKYYFTFWSTQTISTYCWLRLLWNPDINIPAVVDAFCQRMFGPAAESMKELVQLQMDGWEKNSWPSELLGPQAIYESSYPRKKVERMEVLLKLAAEQAAGDSLVLKRIEHYAKPFDAFFKSSAAYAGRKIPEPFVAYMTKEKIKVDGKLDEPIWNQVEGTNLLRADNGAATNYKSVVKAAWHEDGLVVAFQLAEPTPATLEMGRGSRDNPKLWWDDNVEIFVDVTGQNLGEYYQFIVNSKSILYDSKIQNSAWNGSGVTAACDIGTDSWSVEVFLPFKAFPDVNVPVPGVTRWAANFARHRVADTGRTYRKTKKKPAKGSKKEYQRLYTLPIEFIPLAPMEFAK